MQKRPVIGIDEVGRGPIAGPTCVCAFQLRIINYERLIKNTGLKLRDSKKLSQKQREIWFTQIKLWQKEGKCDFAVTMISAKMIDQIGIAKAIQRALDASLRKLKADSRYLILLDGGLHAPKEFKNQKTIIKGDEKFSVISLASIAAKVSRDALMERHALKYPVYGFDSHKGYGTKAHYKAIKKHGLSTLHRRSFLRNLAF